MLGLQTYLGTETVQTFVEVAAERETVPAAFGCCRRLDPLVERLVELQMVLEEH